MAILCPDEGSGSVLGSGSELRLDRLSVRVPGRAAPLLRGVDLRLGPGEVVGVLGPSGAGKSSLLHSISGLLPWHRPGRVEGTLMLGGDPIADLDPGQRAHLLSTCIDRMAAQLFLTTPLEEIAAARRLYGDSPLLDEAIEAFGLRSLLSRRTTELSSGEQQRVALVVALAACPRPVLLDEPLAHLDTEAVSVLGRLLEKVKAMGGSVLLCEQAGWRLGAVVTRWLSIDRGSLSPLPGPPEAPTIGPPGHDAVDEPVLELRGLEVSRGRRLLVQRIDLRVSRGEIVLVSGANGAGKTTLAEIVAGLRRPSAGSVMCSGRVVLMMPSAPLQLFSTTVAAEVRTGGSRESEARVLRRHHLEHLAGRAPWTLSRGEQQRLVHAALDLQRPAVMIVDEPAQGLDPVSLAMLIELLHRRAERGRAYIVISHRTELAEAAHRHLRIESGRLEACR